MHDKYAAIAMFSSCLRTGRQYGISTCVSLICYPDNHIKLPYIIASALLWRGICVIVTVKYKEDTIHPSQKKCSLW
ncbi:hypothetical protein MBAV_005986 [Candidatus Magnetobacterium bavaricum]|uniref:Uncharacterized protein n=1 Tax=Candidatus Magnetobacterium bavaricum TaxID=29290 RepID=A0A0F3GJ24_9BACT|nr:hypothetical protein MBAV_005986 [Candidatus Magnetobacterium bavaricum]